MRELTTGREIRLRTCNGRQEESLESGASVHDKKRRTEMSESTKHHLEFAYKACGLSLAAVLLVASGVGLAIQLLTAGV